MLDGARVWDPYRSKLSALYYLGKGIELTPAMRVLYLGAANGTTVSHVADYVEVVYAVEFAPRPMQDLLEVCRRRRNIIPIMADAARPEQYAPLVESVDLLYQDVAQPDQAAIVLRNSVFLKPGGIIILMLKTRSVDVRKEPNEVFSDTLDLLTSAGLVMKESEWLAPFHADHAAIICIKPEA
jgi:fibrillarin-like pre-rRNA processing protein